MKVRELLKLLEEDGWYLVRKKGANDSINIRITPAQFRWPGSQGGRGAKRHVKCHTQAIGTEGMRIMS